ncbi:MAG: hypothetical protein EXR39_11190 [Betaproteobacteria bacterium]|nr:hypothetical protein [Betaproteobacteria bacterium]
MNFSRFFVDRLIFAGVLSVIIFVAGLLALFRLPVSEYPEVVPPSVVARAAFPGANPRVIAETVASPLEESINGVENMLYMSSQLTADGALQLTITFIQEARATTALLQYEQTVLRALEEAEGGLVAYSRARQREESLRRAAIASAGAVKLARLRFEGGVSDFLTVLDAERRLLQDQDQLAQSEMTTATALVAVYKALGGGWKPVAD